MMNIALSRVVLFRVSVILSCDQFSRFHFRLYTSFLKMRKFCTGPDPAKDQKQVFVIATIYTIYIENK